MQDDHSCLLTDPWFILHLNTEISIQNDASTRKCKACSLHISAV